MPSCPTDAARTAADVARPDVVRPDVVRPDVVRPDLAHLRRAIAAIERDEAPPDLAAGGLDARSGPGADTASAHLPLGVPQVDAALGGGLLWGGLHEASAAAEHAGVLSAFALGLAARAVMGRRRPLLLVQQDLAPWEAGGLYGPGLAAFGLSPGAVLLVRVRRPQDVMFVMEEGLKCPGLAAVLGEVLAPVLEALTATRRLSLAARGRPVLGLLVRHTAAAEPCAAASRWVLSPLPSPAPDGLGGLGPPRGRVQLVRNRFGPPGAWPLAFAGGTFRLAPEEGLRLPAGGEGLRHDGGDDDRDDAAGSKRGAALSQPQPAAPAHRPARAADVA